ncbi:alpha/beta hydrolase fold [Alloscardovia macacae]|uniref:Alpha/beta hydrolase fold n=2 Tax=Alloscardovia macacae TaxID=1160091 RepID=A0A261F740_9BIFI|nr:alpha/beta hydrolase fold [Alloscardovia macacae]
MTLHHRATRRFRTRASTAALACIFSFISLIFTPPVASATEGPDSVSTEELTAALEATPYSEAFLEEDGTYRIGEPIPSSASPSDSETAPDTPPTLQKYYTQQLTGVTQQEDFGSFTSAFIIVPIDYAQPDAGNVALHLNIFPATGQKKGMLLFNNGGPGGKASEYVAEVLDTPQMRALNESYDLVGLDPRGVGSSLPFAQCAVDEFRDVSAGAPAVYTDDLSAQTAANVARTREYVRSCFSYTGRALGLTDEQRALFLRNMDSTSAAQDMDVVRSVLGEEKLNFVGLSYGTRLGYVYARSFPQRVGRLVLDGAVSPYEGTAPTAADATTALTDEQLRALNALDLTQASAFQNTFEQFAQWCFSLSARAQTWAELTDGGIPDNRTAACPLQLADVQPHDGDLADDAVSLATQQVQNILRPLATQPLTHTENLFGTERTTSLSFDVAVTALSGGLYSQDDWPVLAYGLAQIHAGQIMPEYVRLYSNFEDTDGYGNAAYTAVTCADGANPAGASLENSIRVQTMLYAAAPYRDPGAQYHGIGSLSACSAWPFAGNLSADAPGTHVENLALSLPPTLVVSTTHDPATPYANGEILARALGGSLLSVEGAQHVAWLRTGAGYACANDIMVSYLLNGTVPQDGAYGELCSVRGFAGSAGAGASESGGEAARAGEAASSPSTPDAPDIPDTTDAPEEKRVKTSASAAPSPQTEKSSVLAKTGADVVTASALILVLTAAGAAVLMVRRHRKT